MNSLRKYLFGILALGLLTAILAAYVLLQGASAKQDNLTLQAAKDAAEKINSYVTEKNEIPASLNEAGVKSAPNTIKYTKKSASEFEFCATYKKANQLNIGSFDQILFGLTAGGQAASSSSYGNYDSSYLYIDDQYKAGENCQTIKPYIYSPEPLNDSSTDLCSPENPDYELYKEYCAEINPPSIVN